MFVLIKDDNLSDVFLDELNVFSSKTEITNYLLLKCMVKMNEPVGSWVLKSMLDQKNINVSTATIGRFLKSLDAKGYTELIESKGRIITTKGINHVNELSSKVRREKLQMKVMKAAQPESLNELLDLMSARKALECETARLGALRANAQNIKDLEKSVEMHQECLDKLRDPTSPALDFHGKVAEASNIRFLIASLDILMNEELKMESRFLEITREKASEYVEQHRLIAKAIKNGDAEEAEKQMAIHMDSMIAALEKLAEE